MQNIKDLREKYNLTRKSLSILTGIPVRTIQSWELGDRVAPDYIYSLIENTLKQNIQALPEKTIIVPSNEYDTSILNSILKKDIYSLTKEDITSINAAYIAQMEIERKRKDRGGIYGYTQRTLAYNSSKIEGNQLTEEDTANLFDTEQLPMGEFRRKDVEEMTGHFLMFNYALVHIADPLSPELIKAYHRELVSGVFEYRANGYPVGEYKSRINTVSNITTSRPEDVANDINNLLSSYNSKSDIDINMIAKLHADYERIHPFQDGNGRTGRMILFKECLSKGELPLIVDDKRKRTYYDGLKVYGDTLDITTLSDYLKSCQEQFYTKLQEYMYDHSITLNTPNDLQEERNELS